MFFTFPDIFCPERVLANDRFLIRKITFSENRCFRTVSAGHRSGIENRVVDRIRKLDARRRPIEQGHQPQPRVVLGDPAMQEPTSLWVEAGADPHQQLQVAAMEEPASEPEEVDEAGEAAEATWAAPAAAAADGAAMAAALVEAASTARRAASLRARGLLLNLRARNIPASPSAREQRNQHSLLQSGSYLRRRWVTAYAYQQVHMYVKKSFMTTAVHPPFTGSLKFMQRPFGPSVRTVFVQQMRQFRQQLLCRYRRQPVSVTMSTVRIPAETPFSPQLFL